MWEAQQIFLSVLALLSECGAPLMDICTSGGLQLEDFFLPQLEAPCGGKALTQDNSFCSVI